MSDQKKDSNATTQDNAMPSEPTATDETITTLDNAMPSEPAKEAITTMDNAMPAPPALGRDGNK
ncbi:MULTISPECIES: hypothetical protein [unclassified Streptomyces]|uniref:hypothetical protein n=1 Tax=unclassified Streptomyces TaxID=2593676 RepID=UPI001661BD6B|nr:MULTISPECIES: hypothetical protein [unclassified Streptomyces]MBD0844281.1 hypothetical protein [Streptomyces sp. TRM68416]